MKFRRRLPMFRGCAVVKGGGRMGVEIREIFARGETRRTHSPVAERNHKSARECAAPDSSNAERNLESAREWTLSDSPNAERNLESAREWTLSDSPNAERNLESAREWIAPDSPIAGNTRETKSEPAAALSRTGRKSILPAINEGSYPKHPLFSWRTA